MSYEDSIKEILEDLLKKLDMPCQKIEITDEDEKNYTINLVSDNPSYIIGYHGDNIQALQHLVKVIAWKKTNSEQFNIMLDVDNYRKRQEDNALNLAKRKIATARKTGKAQMLPPMSAYLRRKIHLHCMESGNEDIETYSDGEGENRHIVIKVK